MIAINNDCLKHLVLSLVFATTLSAYGSNAVAAETAVPAGSSTTAAVAIATPVSEDQAPAAAHKMHPITRDADLLGVFDNLPLSFQLQQAVQGGDSFSLPGSKNITMQSSFEEGGAGNSANLTQGFPVLSGPYGATTTYEGTVMPYLNFADGMLATVNPYPSASFAVVNITGMQPLAGGGYTLDPVGTISKPTSTVLVVYNDNYID